MRRRFLGLVACLLGLVGLLGLAPESRPQASIAIGQGESDTRTHVAFETPQGLVAASVHVVVDRTASVGLNFFALEVDFNNGTWAHGGLQDVNGPDNPSGSPGPRVRQVNWGGLVDRGGGNADYDEADASADLLKIQNPPAGQHLGPYAWKNGVEYEYLVERGAKVTLPPGSYSLTPGDDPVRLDRARQMWEWRLTVRPVPESEDSNEPFVAVLYNSADTIDAVLVWNESGYGSSDREQLTRWSQPLVRPLEVGRAQAPASWERF